MSELFERAERCLRLAQQTQSRFEQLCHLSKRHIEVSHLRLDTLNLILRARAVLQFSDVDADDVLALIDVMEGVRTELRQLISEICDPSELESPSPPPR